MSENRVKNVAAVHDLCGVGRVSLTAVIPILSSMGIHVCPLPTAVLSNHTQYPEFIFLDLTGEMRKTVDLWKKMNLSFDAVYSGYLGSPDQVQIVSELIDHFRSDNCLVVIDPVLGDNGHLYTNFDDQMVRKVQSFIHQADVITPNLTELFYLLGRSYKEENSEQELQAYMRQVTENGPRAVIVTSVPVPGDGNKTSVYAYDRVENRYWKAVCPYFPAHFPGTGDSFTSVITGSLLQGDSLPVAIDRATQFILQGIRATFECDYNSLEGVQLEKVLHFLNDAVEPNTFEMEKL